MKWSELAEKRVRSEAEITSQCEGMVGTQAALRISRRDDMRKKTRDTCSSAYFSPRHVFMYRKKI